MKAAIVIPARYGSTRFPGKPLARIAGKTMLQHVGALAEAAAADAGGTEVLVATEDERILKHAEESGFRAVLTSSDCKTGSDRVLAALSHLAARPDFVVNLQGDTPFTPPDFLTAVLRAFQNDPGLSVVTPVVRLSWEDLDAFRESKNTTPHSGTSAIVGKDGEALWFSKQLLPAIRNEETLRTQTEHSPVYRHIGIYGFRTDILEKFVALPQSHYEKLEGLEQLRLLENGIPIRTVTVDYRGRPAMPGIDSEEDIVRAEALLKKYGGLAA